MKDKRLIKLLSTRSKDIRGGQMLDTYNQQIQEGLSCTIRTNINTANHHFIVEEVKIIKEGNYSPSGHNASSIVSIEDISPTVMENHGTVTAIKEPRVITVGYCYQSKQNGRVCDIEGINPTIYVGAHYGCEPKILEPQALTPKRTDFGKAIRKRYEQGEIKMSRHDMTTMEPREDGVSNTLTSVQKDNYICIPEATQKGYAEAHEGNSVNLAAMSSKTRIGRVREQMANTLDTGCQQGVVERANDMPFRIRKLTPRECFRLMGVDDKDIDKIQSSGISNSSQYKLAGNSIVVDTLYYLLKQLLITNTNEEQEEIQLKLF